jgi:hypothetical protein
MPHFTLDEFTYAVKIAGGVGSFVAFCIAVSTYYRTERWKRAEFLAHEMKEFFASPRVQKAMLLIDWGERRINLLENVPEDQAILPVNRAMQVRGLRPHIIVTGDLSDSEGMAVGDGDSKDRFSQPEAAIRDCYDAFLDGLERFASYAKTGLTNVASLRPYIGYWIEDISEPTKSPEDAAWNAALLTYISYYRFTGVLWLFERFGKDITPGSALYRSLLVAMADQVFARTLAATVGVTYTLAQNVPNIQQLNS